MICTIPDSSRDTMPERLVQDDCELRALAVEEPIERSLSKSNDYSETYLETSTGRILVAHTMQEITNSKPVIIAYHDLGLNYVSNFQAFFNFREFKVILDDSLSSTLVIYIIIIYIYIIYIYNVYKYIF